MIVSELPYIKRRSALKSSCPICSRVIRPYDDIQALRLKEGRYVQHLFIHTSCAYAYIKKHCAQDERVVAAKLT